MIDQGTRLVLWRHGRTGFNVRHRFQGRQDVPLAEARVTRQPWRALLRPFGSRLLVGRAG
ncbi:histidine phosphatase family protein [Propionibacterium australiense]|uniref:histidine phosphatase family protein n=1 Tax=Propionibacterium australiense TaxID=119981 RepID=UPI001476A0C2